MLSSTPSLRVVGIWWRLCLLFALLRALLEMHHDADVQEWPSPANLWTAVLVSAPVVLTAFGLIAHSSWGHVRDLTEVVLGERIMGPRRAPRVYDRRGDQNRAIVPYRRWAYQTLIERMSTRSPHDGASGVHQLHHHPVIENVDTPPAPISVDDLPLVRDIAHFYDRLVDLLAGASPDVVKANTARALVYKMKGTLALRKPSWSVEGLLAPVKVLVDGYSRRCSTGVEVTVQAQKEHVDALTTRAKSMIPVLSTALLTTSWPSPTHFVDAPTRRARKRSGKAPIAVDVPRVARRRPSARIDPRVCHVRWSSAICVGG